MANVGQTLCFRKFANDSPLSDNMTVLWEIQKASAHSLAPWLIDYRKIRKLDSPL